jgi:glycosyltransferase involved in cell wall biosynthesis/putative flippase GtrA
MIASLINIRFIRFLIVGVVNTGFSYGVYSLLIYSGVEYRQATLGALIAGIFFSFKTQGKFVFNNSENRLFFRFLFCWIIIYFFNIYFIERMLLLGFNAYEAGAIALAPVTVFSFLVQKLIVFRKSPTVQELAISSEAAVFPVTYKQTHLAIVIPCYNEEEVLSETNVRLLKLLEDMLASGLIAAESSIYYVDDGSRDKTWDLISGFHRQNPQVHGVKLSRNRGHQNALLAGLFSANGQAVISIDADLQDDIEVIKDMLYRYNEGYEIVYGVRSSRKTDSLFKRTTAQFYYKVLKMMGVELVYNHADYRLMSQRVIECLKDYHEVNLFLRGIIPQLGFKYTTVFYERNERFAGESKYPLRKMLALAADGITSFSVLPLRMITWLGLWVSFGSLLMVVWILVGKYFMQTTIPGWASSVLPIYFIGGIQLLSIGILGEYLAKIYMETKQRPRYFIDEVI